MTTSAMPPLTRRLALALPLMLGLALPGLQARAEEKPVLIRQGIFVGAGLPGIYAAIDQGYFRAEGIELKLEQFNSGPAFIAALLGGSLDITHADVLAWATAIGGGRDVILIAGGSDVTTPDGDADGTTRIVATKASGITKPQDLIGKTIAVGASQLTIATTKVWLENSGVDPGTVSFEIVAQGAGIPPLLRNGTVATAHHNDGFPLPGNDFPPDAFAHGTESLFAARKRDCCCIDGHAPSPDHRDYLTALPLILPGRPARFCGACAIRV